MKKETACRPSKKMRLLALIMAAAIVLAIPFAWHLLRPAKPQDLTIESLGKEEMDKLLSKSSKETFKLPVFGHRGYVKDDILQNSFESFDAAIAAGVPQIELDVRLSRDGQLIVSHDESLKAITGKNIKVSSRTARELQEMEMLNGEHVHTLADVFHRYGSSVIYLVDFKDNLETDQPFYSVMMRYPRLARNILVQSFDSNTLKVINEDFPAMFKQVLLNDPKKLKKVLMEPYIDSLGITIDIASQSLIEQIHAFGKEVWVWTVDKKGDMERMVIYGADGIISDVPDEGLDQYYPAPQ